METSYLGLIVPKSLSLCTLSSNRFLYLLSLTTQVSLSNDPSKTSIGEYSRMSLGVTLLLQTFDRAVVIVYFHPGPWAV